MKQKPTRLSILVDPEKCTGCGACEKACSARRKGRTEADGPALRVASSRSNALHVPLLCTNCAEAPCTEVCPGEVLSRIEDLGVITVQRAEACSSCSSCILSCPFGVLHMGEPKAIPQPCDLCGGEPACVASCPTGAIESIELDDPEKLERKRSSARVIADLLEELE